jgi:hypothetical protein
MSFWVDLSGCGGLILLFATTVVMTFDQGGSILLILLGIMEWFLLLVCPVGGWLALHAAACKKAAHYASEAIKGSF